MSIKSLDDGHFWERLIVEYICNLNFDEYFIKNELLSKKHLEKNIDRILKYFGELREKSIFSLNYIALGYQILAYLILKTGSSLPSTVKEEVLISTTSEFDKIWNWSNSSLKIREIFLKEFRGKILNHNAGRKHCFRHLHIHNDEELKNSLIGLNDFYNCQNIDIINSIKYINLDCCNLFEFPNELFKFSNLEILSLNFNSLSKLPEEIENFHSLVELYLLDNKINSLPKSLNRLISLNKILLVGNPINKMKVPISSWPPKIASAKIKTKKFYDIIYQ
jgi:hypothetical protein